MPTDPLMSASSLSRGPILALGVFLLFGALAASYAATTLLFPGTGLDRAWALNPRAHQQLLTMGRGMSVPFILLASALALAATGWFRYRLWAWRLTVAIVATQLLGDALNFYRGDFLAGAFGVLAASALLFYLFRPTIRSAFPAR